MDRGDGLGGGAIFNEPLLAAGADLAGYRIESLLGRGGMGVVYRAHDLALDRKVALKLLAPELARDARFRDRFLRESRLAASLDHPAIVPIHDAGEVAGQLYIAMRLVAGSDLKRLLAEEGTLEPAHALALIGQVADALDAAHERGLVHRDVKPSNVLIDERGHCYLADFGLSRRLNEHAAEPGLGRSLGTVDYVAPEQIRGDELDGRADLYSLGCLLYECLAGYPPFAGRSPTAIAFAHLQQEPPALPGLDDVMRTALAKEADDRYQSGRELVAAARAALGLDRPPRRRWPLAVGAVAVALITALLLALFLPRTGGGPQAEPGADSLVRIDPKTNRLADVMPVGRTASGVAAHDRFVWVTSFADGTVWRIDSRSRATVKIPVNGSPTGVAAAPGSVLVADGPGHSLASVDPAKGTVSYVTRLAGDASGSVPLAARDGRVWFADATTGIVGQTEQGIRTAGAVAEEIPVAPLARNLLSRYEAFDGLAAGEGAIWVVGDAFGRRAWRLDPRSRRVVASIQLPFVPGGIATGYGAVWISSLLDDTVVRIDPAANRVVATIRVGRGADEIAAGAGGVWVLSSIAREVSRIDPADNRVVATVHTLGTPTHVAVGAGGVWVTTTRPAPVVRRGTIGVGVLADCAGPWASWYEEALAGAELVLLQHGARLVGANAADGVAGARIAGKPVTLALGCMDRTTGSALVQARRLVEEVGVRVVIGPTYASEELALQEYARRHPGIAFVNGVASAQLSGSPANFFVFDPNAVDFMAGLGTYAYRTLGWRRAVTVTDGADGLFNWAQTAGFVAEFCAQGGTIVKRLWVPPGTQDYSGVIAQIPRDVDGIAALASGPQTVVALAGEVPGLRGNLARRLVLGSIAGGPQLAPFGQQMGDVLQGGSFLATPGAAGRRYLAELHRAFPHLPIGGSAFDIYYHDAMAATVAALAAADGDLSGGERRFMAALAKVRLKSPTGPIRLDRDRQAIGPNYLLRLDGRLYRSVDGVERTFGGYFTGHDPPPGEATPVCKRRTPPPWVR